MPKLRCHDLDVDYTITGEGPPLVFIHGAFTDRHMWRPQVAAFRDRHKVITFDLRGHGASGPSAHTAYDIAVYAQDLAGLLDGLGVERAAFVGASLGGMIAQMLAARHPERVEGLFLLSSFADTTEQQPDLPPFHLVPNWVVEGALNLLGMRIFVAIAKRIAAIMQGHPVTASNDEPPMVRMRPAEVAKVYKSIFTFRAEPAPGLAIPVLVACGEREHPVMKAQSGRVAELYGVPLVDIPGGAHIASLEATAAFIELVDAFLSEVETARRSRARTGETVPA